eukprot:CAMPEP_0117451334 /NCGR_PEP_ID=MMETSP0759-20121206/8951_1 /TAXON_ID=63605 /ORGANISM="Percolomonas cosmopolitus, Strain WS" /LENGTH=366 /DNA_ID=CAMNT_0005243925 /DNA_START=47 /DNA_END=1147 /DNA_ORIENTATION=-
MLSTKRLIFHPHQSQNLLCNFVFNRFLQHQERHFHAKGAHFQASEAAAVETQHQGALKKPLYNTNLNPSHEDYSHLIPQPMDYTQFFKPGFKRPSIRQVKLAAKEDFVREENLDISDMSLNALRRVPYSRKVKIRVGRGQGGRRGKYCGRGLNGQKSRAGKHVPLLFEGGQLKLSRRAPKFGFSNKRFELKYQKVSLEKLQFFIDTGRIDPTQGRITMKTFLDAGLVRKVSYPGLKLVANGGVGALRTPIDIEIPRASLKAIQAIESAGGSIASVYYDRNSILAMIRGEDKYLQKHYKMPKRAIPPPKLYRYYMRKDVRGYLSDESLMLAERSAPAQEKAQTKKELQNKLKAIIELRRQKARVKKF